MSNIFPTDYTDKWSADSTDKLWAWDDTSNFNLTVDAIWTENFSNRTTDDLTEWDTNLYLSDTNLSDSSIITDLQANKEDNANKSTSITTDTWSNTKYPSVSAVETYVTDEIADYSIPDATTTVKGKVKLATESEATDATSTTSVVTAEYLWTFWCIASDTVRASADTEVSRSSWNVWSYTKYKEIEITDIPKGWTIRVTYKWKREDNNPFWDWIFSLRKNWTELYNDSSDSTSYITYTYDISVNNWDLIQLYLSNDASSYIVYAENFRISYDWVFSKRTVVNLD